MSEGLKRLFWVATAVVLAICVWQLEAERSSVTTQEVETRAGPVTLYHQGALPQGPLVVVAHGFAGSRQMMQYISRDLARAGFTVAAFDFQGHGRNARPMSPDVTRIEGTTRQLVAQTRDVIGAIRAQVDLAGPIALLGHSMATDIIIRAAGDMSDVAAIVAISMYSEAITPSFPARLLVLSGEWEGRLRDAGLRAVAQIDPEAVEGETVGTENTSRRSVSVPRTEHVAVLFSPVTFAENRAWLAEAFDMEVTDAPMSRGRQIVLVLLSVVVLTWPLARLLPHRRRNFPPLSMRAFWAAAILPAPPAMIASIFAGGSIAGLAAFGSLAVFFAVWGSIALALLWAAGRRPREVASAGALLLLVMALVFALALDRYAAAFLPAGPRLLLFAVLALATWPFALADRLLVADAPLWRRIVARVLPVGALAVAMILSPQDLGLMFTALPVLVLYFAVYGTMGRAVARRSGPETAGIALAFVLAWSLAASMPLFSSAVGY